MAKGSKNYVEFHEEKKNLQKFRINLFSKKMQNVRETKMQNISKRKVSPKRFPHFARSPIAPL